MKPEAQQQQTQKVRVVSQSQTGTRNIVLLGLTSFFTDISSEMIYPLIPLFLTSTLGATPAFVGIIEGLAESLASVLKVFFGRLSDVLHRRKPLALAGYAASTLAKIAFYLAGSWTTVLLGRLGDRFGKGVRTAPRDAIIAESSRAGARGQAFGLHRALDTAGAVTGVFCAYLLLRHWMGNMRLVFLWAVVPAVIALLFLALVRDTSPKDQPARKAAPDLPAEADKEDKASGPLQFVREFWTQLPLPLRSFIIVSLIFTLGNSSNQFLLLRAQDIGFDTAQVLLLYLVFNVTYALGSYPAGLVSDRIGPRPILIGGYATYALVYLGFSLVSPASAWVLFALYGIYLGLTDGVSKALVAELCPREHRGSVLGLHAAVVGIGLLPASVVAGFLWTAIGPSAPFLFGAVMGLAAAVGIFIFVRPRSAKQLPD